MLINYVEALKDTKQKSRDKTRVPEIKNAQDNLNDRFDISLKKRLVNVNLKEQKLPKLKDKNNF